MMELALASRLAAAAEIASEAGGLALSYFGQLQPGQVSTKGPHDVVSAADLAVEELLRQRIAERFPTDQILGEEQGGASDTAGPLWVLDPIDGTGEFVRGSRSWCLVISYVESGLTQMSVVHMPCGGETFAAVRGAGATLNGARIAAARPTSLADGVVTIEHSAANGVEDIAGMVRELLVAGGSFVREGSGAMGICHTACGRSLGFIELHLRAWDCLGPLLIAQEAGCTTTDFIGSGFMSEGGPVLAAAPTVASDLLALLPDWAKRAQVLSNRAP